MRKIRIRREKDSKPLDFYAFVYTPTDLCDENLINSILEHTRKLLIESWGDLGDEITQYIIRDAHWILLLFLEEKITGISVVHKKRIFGQVFYDVELTSILPEYRGLGLMGSINRMLLSRAFVDNLVHHFKWSLDIVFTTANMRVLGTMAKIASYCYPNPFNYNQQLRSISPADDETWEIAQEFIANDVPENMKLEREACVVSGSYEETPWLMHDSRSAPKYDAGIVNEFAERYLQYSKKTGKKFFVRARITLWDLTKYSVSRLFSR